nr:uncharacterized protein LOC119173410 [Rhipicephalus microplus]
MLRDHVVYGTNNVDVQTRLLKKLDLTFNDAVQTTLATKAAKRDAVKTAKWAAPIVPVTKRDGRIRISGNFVVTINPVATVEQYPIPRIEDLWTVLAGDNGPAFTSAQHLEFLTPNGIRRMLVPPYHPAPNGAAEKVVQTVKNKLKKSGCGNCQTQIFRFLFHCKATPHEVTGRPPCDLLTGRMLKTLLYVLRTILQASVFLKQLKQKLYADRGSRQAPSLRAGDDVYARNFRRGTPWVPASVVDVTPSSASVWFEDGTLGNRHSNHLRPVQTETLGSPETANAAAPPQLEPPLHHSPAVPEVPHQEELPGTSCFRSSCATESDGTAINSGVHVNSDSVVPTPSTPKLRRGTRTRKPLLGCLLRAAIKQASKDLEASNNEALQQQHQREKGHKKLRFQRGDQS